MFPPSLLLWGSSGPAAPLQPPALVSALVRNSAALPPFACPLLSTRPPNALPAAALPATVASWAHRPHGASGRLPPASSAPAAAVAGRAGAASVSYLWLLSAVIAWSCCASSTACPRSSRTMTDDCHALTPLAGAPANHPSHVEPPWVAGNGQHGHGKSAGPPPSMDTRDSVIDRVARWNAAWRAPALSLMTRTLIGHTAAAL